MTWIYERREMAVEGGVADSRERDHDRWASLVPATCRCTEPLAEVNVDSVNVRVEISCHRCGRPRTELDVVDLRALARARRR